MSEIYMEGRFKMPVIDTDDLGYDGDEVKKFDWEEFAKDEFWNSCEDMGELEDKYDITFQRVQPQLTIPKSIADELDSVFAGIDATDIGYVLDQTGPYGSRAFNDYYFKNKNIIALYLAGKALGVDLVKVVEGINDNY
ncbi:hypothetical protein N489_11700 [Lactococcus lactis subsp. lactis 1AA59]|uniref:hypothetical protein n=1 Tax=Lactococcus lactis TaxID=1358 RepID=UPI0005390A7A|nr:hypothetical protein [Lactococcus lactis]KHE76000.1 hypothetical protein N489_11700 [Lactococcus lactis subsp. lactis 1AA59]